jgi:hypothetical protein
MHGYEREMRKNIGMEACMNTVAYVQCIYLHTYTCTYMHALYMRASHCIFSYAHMHGYVLLPKEIQKAGIVIHA